MLGDRIDALVDGTRMERDADAQVRRGSLQSVPLSFASISTSTDQCLYGSLRAGVAEETERRYIRPSMEAVADKQPLAAQILEVGRKTLYRKLVQYATSE